MKQNQFLAMGGTLLVTALTTQAIPTTITQETESSWYNNINTGGFGSTQTGGIPTYGQTFTAPAGVTTLDSFEFNVQNLSGPLQFHAYVYAWNGTSVTGNALFTSTLQTLPVTDYEAVPIDTSSTPVTPGQKYVAIFSTIGDPVTAFPYNVRLGVTLANTFPGQNYYYNAADASGPGPGSTDTLADLTSGWVPSSDFLAYKLDFGTAPVPEPSIMGLCAAGLVTALGFYRRKTAGKA